jgi:hypothetical protein
MRRLFPRFTRDITQSPWKNQIGGADDGSPVGEHGQHSFVIGRGDQARLAQIAATLGVLLCENVVVVRLVALDLAGASFLKALGGAAVCF